MLEKVQKLLEFVLGLINDGQRHHANGPQSNARVRRVLGHSRDRRQIIRRDPKLAQSIEQAGTPDQSVIALACAGDGDDAIITSFQRLELPLLDLFCELAERLGLNSSRSGRPKGQESEDYDCRDWQHRERGPITQARAPDLGSSIKRSRGLFRTL
jgi:hypothetical protein